MSARYLGIDVGTSATRVSIVGDGEAVVASAGYDAVRRSDGSAEQDPMAWSAALQEALRATGADLGSIAGIGLCGQTPTLVLVSDAGRPVRPAMTWQDTRARAEAAQLAAQFGDPEPVIGTNLPWSAANLPAKLAWLARHEAGSVRATRWLLQPKDLLGLQLTGEPSSDPWSSKGICRVSDGEPAVDVLAACGWPAEACPPIAPAFTVRGEVTRAAADQFGLPPGIPVTVGWSDALAETLAAGCYERSSAFVFSGTSAIVGAPVPSGPHSAAGLFTVPQTCAPAPLLYGPTQSSGGSIAWVSRLLGCQPSEIPALAATAASAHPAPTFVPYLSGERAPLWNSDVRGLLLGLSAEHGPAEVARAVLTGTLLSARHVLDIVEEASGRPITEIEFAGRGSADSAWQSLALETLGARVRLHLDADLSARGAAIMAAIMASEPPSEAIRRLGDQTRMAEPADRDVQRSRYLSARYRLASRTALDWQSISQDGSTRGVDGREQA